MLVAWSLIDAFSRNWAMVAIISTIAILVIVPTLVLGKYVRIALNIMRTTKPPLARSPLDFARIAGEPLTFPAFDGLPLAGMLIRAGGSQHRGLIVFAHEYCADLYSCARYCRPLVDAGYDILTFDFRGHGQSECPPRYSPRQWVTDRELDDMRGAVAFAERWLIEHDRPPEVGLFGVSRGACAAILVAQENPRVTALTVDGAFSTDTSVEYFMRRWAYIFAGMQMDFQAYPQHFWRLLRWLMIGVACREFGCRFPSVRKAIAAMQPRPMLFIHGAKDSYLPVEQSRKLYALAGQPKYLWVAPQARHNQAAIVHPEFYARLTVGFFDRYLARLPQAAFPKVAAPAPAPADELSAADILSAGPLDGREPERG